MSVRRCRECGQPLRTERRTHGRGRTPELWFVHTRTDRIPCDPTAKAAKRAQHVTVQETP